VASTEGRPTSASRGDGVPASAGGGDEPVPGRLYLSGIVGSPLLDRRGERLGRVDDLVVRLDDASAYPPVTGLLARVGPREVFVPVDLVAELAPGRARLGGERLSLARFERRPGEVLLARDLAARHLINLVGGRLVTARDIVLECRKGRWAAVGVDTARRSLLRRLRPRSRRGRDGSGPVLDWSDVAPLLAHVPSAGLRLPLRKLSHLHPARIADIVEAASHDEGEEIIRTVAEDRELEADVFEELDLEHQLEFLRTRSDEEAARVLSEMEPDDAADLLGELDEERRAPLLALLPEATRQSVRTLLRYNPETAGGLMNPDVVSAPASGTAGDALDAVRRATTPPEAAAVVFVLGPAGELVGVAPLAELLRSPADAPLAAIAREPAARLHPEADVHEVLRTMSDFNLAALPVVDGDGRLLGQVTVDDVLELLLPTGWRRDYGMDAPA
jgi:CBS domain-containing protein